MLHPIRIALASFLAAALILSAGTVTAQPGAGGVRLIVLLVVDQFRADYAERYGHQWTAGLKRLFDRGAVFRRAPYPYLNTITCASHATLATGAFPATHGVVLNNWYDRERGRLVNCVEDPGVAPLSYAIPMSAAGSSPHRLLAPTLADELRAQLAHPPRLVTLAGKPRSAIMLAGRRADVAVWTEPAAGGPVTSAAYASSPVPMVANFVRANPIEKDLRSVWTRRLPADAYLYDDDPLGRTATEGFGASFPHALTASPTPDRRFYTNWMDSPFVDDYIGRMASGLLESLSLGRGPSTDFLGVSFSGVDRVGHDFGPFSHEVQDALVRVDATIGALLDDLDRRVPDGYVVALSSDHGVSPVPEQMLAKGFDAGRLTGGRLGRAVSEALRPFFGEERTVSTTQYTQMYFANGVYERLKARPEALDAAISALRAIPGVKQVYRNDELGSEALRDDPLARAARLSYFPGRSGELTIIPKPYWIMSNEAATHGTSYDYDARVPVILMGRGIRPGTYLESITPADIAPTLAFVAGITLARPDGRVLIEALKKP
jgi:hypothetical protein